MGKIVGLKQESGILMKAREEINKRNFKQLSQKMRRKKSIVYNSSFFWNDFTPCLAMNFLRSSRSRFPEYLIGSPFFPDGAK